MTSRQQSPHVLSKYFVVILLLSPYNQHVASLFRPGFVLGSWVRRSLHSLSFRVLKKYVKNHVQTLLLSFVSALLGVRVNKWSWRACGSLVVGLWEKICHGAHFIEMKSVLTLHRLANPTVGSLPPPPLSDTVGPRHSAAPQMPQESYTSITLAWLWFVFFDIKHTVSVKKLVKGHWSLFKCCLCSSLSCSQQRGPSRSFRLVFPHDPIRQ